MSFSSKTSPTRGSGGAEKASTRRVLTASLVGTSVEFYDFYVYTTAAALVFGQLFFPAGDGTTAQMASLATIGVAFIARPLGSIFFGHFGDKVGRKSTLVASLLTMGISTVLVGLLPTFTTIGWPATALLCLMRFGQGFGLGGEWGGAALLAVEHAPPGWRARYGMFPQLGAPVGFIAANGIFLLLGLLLTPAQFADWGWRIPFLLSAVLVTFGLWIRVKLEETPAFSASLAEGPPPAVPFAELIARHSGALILGTLGAVACFALYYIATAFALSYGTRTLGYSMSTFLSAQLGAICFMAVGTVAAAFLADAGWGERRVLMVGCIGTIVIGALMAPMMVSGALPLVFMWMALALFMMGFVYGPLGAWLPVIFPPRVRYTGASIAFNAAGVLGGGVTPYAATWLADTSGLSAVGVYVGAASVLSIVALLAAGRLRGHAESRV